MRGNDVARGAGAAVLAVGLAVGLTGCWGQPGFGPLHQGANPIEDHLTVANVATLDVAWTAHVDDGPVRSDPVVSGPGLVHVSDDEGVYGLAAGTGARRWRTQVVPAGQPDEVVPTPVSTEGDRVHVAWGGAPDTGGRSVFAATTGAPVAAAAGLGVEALTLRDPWLVTTFSGFVEGTVAGAGIGVEGPTRWGLTFGLEVGPKLPTPTGPAVTTDRVYVGIDRSWFGNDLLAGWDLAPGCVNIPQPPLCVPQVKAQLDGRPTGPVIADGEQTVYVATDAGTVYALNADTGAVRWKASMVPPAEAT